MVAVAAIFTTAAFLISSSVKANMHMKRDFNHSAIK